MAEKKKHNIVSADGSAVDTKEEKKAEAKSESSSAGTNKKVKDAKPVGNATGLRIGAVVLWVLAVGFEIVDLLIMNGNFNFNVIPTLYQLIILLVLDLICVIAGSMLWKKANHIDPVSKSNKVKFWLWNNMGLIACIIAFVPFVILLLTNKKLDGNTKKIATIVAIVALLIGGVASYDFNPVSLEEKDAAVSTLGDTQVYWAPFGKVYHTHEDCQALNNTDTLTMGTVEQAIAANRTRLCSFCAKKDDITGVVTTDGVIEDRSTGTGEESGVTILDEETTE